MKSLFLVLAFALTLAGCATTGTTGTGSATAQTQVFAVKTNYDAALKAALLYANLPKCGTAAATSPVICSKPEVTQRLVQAKNVAAPVIASAEVAVRDPTFNQSTTSAVVAAANAAVAALTAITATLPAQK